MLNYMNLLSIPLCIFLITLIYLILKPCQCETTYDDDTEKGWKGYRLVEGNTTVSTLFWGWLIGLVAFIIYVVRLYNTTKGVTQVEHWVSNMVGNPDSDTSIPVIVIRLVLAFLMYPVTMFYLFKAQRK